MEIIERPIYLDHIKSLLNKDMMLILIGQRRVGKSYILRQLKKWIETTRPNANLLYINKELNSFGHIKTSSQLYEQAVSKFDAGGENYLLIDEVQDIEGYEGALRSMHAEGLCQIVATGSNAYVFSSELSTRLSGRYIEIPIYSLGYREFLTFHAIEDSDESLLSYLKVGGLPGLRHFDIKEEAQLRDYLQGVYNTVMMKDVVARENIRNVSFIENLAWFVAENIGKPISPASISKYMKSQGEKISDPLTGNYLRYLSNSLLIRPVRRYDMHGKKILEQNNKFYFSDHGLRNLLGGFNLVGSIEKIIENAVYTHLLINGFTIYVGMFRVGEIDFVAKRGSETIYIQATYLLASEETIKREFGNLAAIKDNYPKYVVSMDPVSGEMAAYPGIRHLRLRDFLRSSL